MADERRRELYVEARDTGFPATPPHTPWLADSDAYAAADDTRVASSGVIFGENVGGPSSGHVVGAVGDTIGGTYYGDTPIGGPAFSDHVAADVTRTSATLENEICRLKREIKRLSMKRSAAVRSDIREALSSDNSDSNVTVRVSGTPVDKPTRTSTKGGGRKVASKKVKENPSRTSSDKIKPERLIEQSSAEAKLRSADDDGSACAVAGGSVHRGETGEACKGDPAPQDPARAVNAAPSAVTPGSSVDKASRDRAARKPLKLERYDGLSVPLETFLAKFTNCVKYNGWSAEERSVFLRDSLHGNASQVLWEISDDANDDDIIKLLRNRFGNSNQMERYRAELHGRRRKRGETVQAVYQDIRRLMALGFPGQAGEMFEILGRDSFLAALNDSSLRVRVLDQNPKTMDDALAIVIRMEAYSDNTGDDDCTDRKRVRVVSPARESEADKRIRKLEECVEKQKREIQQLKGATSIDGRRSQRGADVGGPPNFQGCSATGGTSNGPSGGWPSGYDCGVSFGTNGGTPGSYYGGSSMQGANIVYSGETMQYPSPPSTPYRLQSAAAGHFRETVGGPIRGRGGARRYAGSRLPRDVCARCGARGHWARECGASGVGPGPGGPTIQPGGERYQYGGPDSDQYGGSNTQGPLHVPVEGSGVHVVAGRGRAETYIDVVSRGRTFTALLDSGCDQSVCPLRLCKNGKISPVQTELFAANASPISVVGATRLFFEINGMSIHADVLVTPDVDELILGYEFMERNNCEWLFAQHRIVINGLSVPLHSRPSKLSVRRIFVREPVTIPIDTSVNVPVRMPFINLNTPKAEWVTEPKEIRPGLLAARTLLGHNDQFAAIAFMNVSGVEQSLRQGHSLGLATSCPINAVQSLTDPESVPPGNQPHADGIVSVADGGRLVAGNDDDTQVKCATVHVDPLGSPGADQKAPREVQDFTHIQPVIDRLPDTLMPEQREQAIALIERNADIFSKHEFDVGCTDLLTARIFTGNNPPHAEPLRRHARVHLGVINDTIQKMKSAGICEDASSPWAANLVVVARLNDQGKPTTPRITMDYRGLNAVTYKDRYPIPHLGDCIRSLDNAVYMSTMDLSNSYYQVKIAEEDRDKTAFITPQGQFRLTRLGQGCTNSPAVFCRLMAMVLKGLTCCLCYIDDTICFSPSFNAHLVDLESVFDRFRQANLKLKAAKCKLFQHRCKFVGHIVSANGVEVDPAKVACVKNWPFPKTITELRQFLGLCSYYRTFCMGFAKVADPLTECLRKGVPLQQTAERQEAFDKLKQLLITAPVLAMPRDDDDCTWVLDTDASGTAAAAVLQQWQDGKLRVIEYASRTFNRAERSYCATRREVAALIFGLKQFKSYLLGRRFQVRVDNSAVAHYRRMKDATGQCARYLDFLSLFDFDIVQRPGVKHVNADALSRIRPCEIDRTEPCRQCNRRVTGQHSVNVVQTRAQRQRAETLVDATAVESVEPGPPYQAAPQFTRLAAPELDSNAVPDAAPQSSEPAAPKTGKQQNRGKRGRRRSGPVTVLQATAPAASAAIVGSWTVDEIRKSQLNDGDIAPAVAWLENGSRPPWTEMQSTSPMVRSLWQQFDSLSLQDGVLYRLFYDSKGIVSCHQLVLPKDMKVTFLEIIHASTAGHLKYTKCVAHVMRRAWWFSWKTDLKLFIKCCSRCEAFHRGKPPRQGLLNPMTVGAPGERWAIDLCGPYPAVSGYKYLFTAIDPFSKFGICVPIRDKHASTVARMIVDHIFLKWGLCYEVLTDLGLEFQNELLNELFRLLGVSRLKTSGYRPQTNGVCEVWHRTIHSMMAKVINDSQRDWPEWVPYITFCYNATEHSATGFSPYFVFTGRIPLWTVDLVLPLTTVEQDSLPQYTRRVVENLDRASRLVRDQLSRAAASASRWYNRKAKVCSFNPGDRVRVYYPRRVVGRTPKWQSYYQDGVIMKRLNDVTYVVDSKVWGGQKVVHIDKLKSVKVFTGPARGSREE